MRVEKNEIVADTHAISIKTNYLCQHSKKYPMFDNLSERLESAFKQLKGEGRISEINVATTIKEIRRALVDADVNFKIAKEFTDTVKEKALGEKVLTAVSPGQLMVKIVKDELALLMGGSASELDIKNKPTVILIAGLQGSGKTTFSGKLANYLKSKQGRNPLLVAADVYRPAAMDQLQVLADQIKVPVYIDRETKDAVQIAKEFPDVTWDKELVDAATARMVNRPESLDTVVATNLHADVLSDLAAALAGSLGIAPTGNIDPERRYPSMFEPIHGSAFDIMGKGLANPIGTFWSIVMMLEHLQEPTLAKLLMQVIEQVTANPSLHTRDLGGKAMMTEVTQAVCAGIERS